ncbi:hypothetical protein BDZ97DRAFT_1111867 [Flammula alnicola]|nr:hypothetical protein BDZ97DRAFT_1111867 [Flammula alnicola]
MLVILSIYKSQIFENSPIGALYMLTPTIGLYTILAAPKRTIVTRLVKNYSAGYVCDIVRIKERMFRKYAMLTLMEQYTLRNSCFSVELFEELDKRKWQGRWMSDSTMIDLRSLLRKQSPLLSPPMEVLYRISHQYGWVPYSGRKPGVCSFMVVRLTVAWIGHLRSLYA